MTWVRQKLLRYDIENMSIKEKNEAFNFVKIKNFCSLKDTVKRMERQVTYWENIFSNPISDRELYPEYIENP